MAPRKRSSVLTAEPVQESASASKKRKQIKKQDSGDKNECKDKKPKGRAATQISNETKSEFPSFNKKLDTPKAKQKRTSNKNLQSITKLQVEKMKVETTPVDEVNVEHSDISSFNKALDLPNTKQKRNSKKNLQSTNKLQVEKMEVETMPVDEMNVEQLLALGENSLRVGFNSSNVDDFEDSSNSDMSDFEEVKNADVIEPVIPKEGVNITLEAPNLFNKHKKKQFDWEAHVKRQMNRVRKDLQLLMHKVHVLCWIAHLRFVNSTLNNPSLMQICTTFIKSKNLYPSKYSDLSYLEGILKWFHKNIELKKDAVDPLCTGGLFQELKYQLENKQAFTNRTFIFIFIILLRVLGLKARIVMSFQVLPVKPSLLELYGDVIKARSEKLKSANKPGTSGEKIHDEKSEIANKKSDQSASEKNAAKKKCTSVKSTNQKKNGKSKKDVEMTPKLEEDNSDDEFESEHFKPAIKSTRKNTKVKVTAKESRDAESTSKKQKRNLDVDNKKEIKGNVKSDEDEDDDFTPVSLAKKSNKKKTDKKLSVSGEESEKKKEGSDIWTEVYLEAEEKWICVDVPRHKIHCIAEIYVKTTHPVSYIVACNNDHTMKDVTKRYVPNWHSDTRKKRVDEEWWNETMKPYLPPKTAQDKEEDEDINRQLIDKPLPSSITEFKDHPLYALKRHLLKFEAIYPADAPTLGFVRGEPVYARECVHTLHSREMWYKQARLVRLKEEPYKIVKARPKYDKVSKMMTGEIKKDLPLELFGHWQTENYIPPIATDGKVPRNEYGNVDLFKPCMLPIGTVHLQIPALNRIAKKLDIDCAPATVGFDFHSGGSHPVFDGFVVCEEFKEVLLDAWNKEIDESTKRETEKREKRVYGNWKRLIRGLLIREKLKIKYAFGENSDEEGNPKQKDGKASTSKLKTK